MSDADTGWATWMHRGGGSAAARAVPGEMQAAGGALGAEPSGSTSRSPAPTPGPWAGRGDEAGRRDPRVGGGAGTERERIHLYNTRTRRRSLRPHRGGAWASTAAAPRSTRPAHRQPRSYFRRPLGAFLARATGLHVINITDVGHLDDADAGEDKMEGGGRNRPRAERSPSGTPRSGCGLARVGLSQADVYRRPPTTSRADQLGRSSRKGYLPIADGIYFDVSFPATPSCPSRLRGPGRRRAHREVRASAPRRLRDLKSLSRTCAGSRGTAWGRVPGWHLGCSAMSCATWAPLRYPHRRHRPRPGAPHQRDRPERGARLHPWVNVWMHNGPHFLGEKMSKSLGNISTPTSSRIDPWRTATSSCRPTTGSGILTDEALERPPGLPRLVRRWPCARGGRGRPRRGGALPL